jgi:hypothetical protein
VKECFENKGNKLLTPGGKSGETPLQEAKDLFLERLGDLAHNLCTL